MRQRTFPWNIACAHSPDVPGFDTENLQAPPGLTKLRQSGSRSADMRAANTHTANTRFPRLAKPTARGELFFIAGHNHTSPAGLG